MLYTNNAFPLSHFLWLGFSHDGGCDDRTWELSLSHLRRSCLCLTYFFFFLCACVRVRVCILSRSFNSSFWTQNMQTLSTVLFGHVLSPALQEDPNCAWNSEFAICREWNMNLFCLTAIYWRRRKKKPTLVCFIRGFRFFFSEVIPCSRALSVCVGWNRMAARMQGWVSSVQKYSILSS